MRKHILQIIFLPLLVAGVSGYAQDFSNKGKEFWLAYSYHVSMINNGGNPANYPVMTLYVTSDVNTNYTVDIYGGTVLQTGTITAGQVITVTIPYTYWIDNEGLYNNKAIRVTADKAVAVYAYVTRQAISGATICLPVSVLGREYFSMNFTQISNENNSNSYFTIIAVQDTTTIEITPSANTKNGWLANTTYTITLNKGQIYQVLGTTSGLNGVDLTGSKIKSVASGTSGCKKIVVFSGSGKVRIPPSGCSQNTSDNLFQQLYPVASWGKKYLTVPSYNRIYNYYRIARSDPTANVYLNGVLIPSASFVNNWYQFGGNTPNLVESDKPICVGQYFTTQGCDGNPSPYDPDMIMLNPVEQNISKVTLVSSNLYASPPQHHLHIIMRNGGTGISSFRFDNNPIASSSWITHPYESNYSYLYLSNVTQGYHTLVSDSGFNAIAYGYAPAESYGYSAGSNVKDLYQFIQVINPFGTVPFPATCRGTPFNFAMVFPYRPIQIQWIFGAALNAMGINDTTIYNGGNPIPEDSSWVVNGRTVYRYRLPSTYYITASGTYSITVKAINPTPDNCGNEQQIDFDLQVFDPPQADFTFTTNGCVTAPVSFFDNSNTGGRPVISRYWNFGDGNTTGVFNPTHTYASSGTYNVRYSLITDVGCLSDTTIHPVTVNNPPTAGFTVSAPLCPNVPVTFTDNSTATGGAILNKWTWDFGDGSPPVIVIAPNPPNQIHTYTSPGTYNATLVVETTTGCPSPVFTLPVVILPNGTVTLTSSPGTDNQTVCINTAITNITYAIGGSSNGGSVTGLPTGITGSFASGIITISGIPTVSGVFNYTVTTTGPCVNPTASGTITVTQDGTITLTSAPGTDSQTVCINTPIVTITYAVGGSGTGGNVSGLPAGITGTFAGGVITITGIPTVSGVFNYTVNTTGPCFNPTTTGRIIVTADGTITLTSAPGTDNQTVCINTSITNITYAVGGSSNGGSVSGLPAGVNGIFAAGVITISGTPAVSGIFNYSVTTTGPCVNPTISGTINVTADGTITLISAPGTNNQAVCMNSLITNILYSVGGSSTGGSVSGLPAGVTGTYAAGIITISGAPTVSGTFNYTVTTTGPCVNPTATGTILVYPLPTSSFSYSAPSCETGIVCFTDLSVANAGNIVSWSWNFGDGGTSTLQNPCHTFLTAGTYNVTLVVTTNNGCVSINPAQQVIIYPKPLAGYIIPEVCLNDTYAQFTDTSRVTSPDFISAWLWDFGDPGSGANNTSTLQNPQHSYSATGPYNVQLIVTSNRGCRDTIVQVLFVNGSYPVANFNVINPTTLCANDSVSISEASTVFPGSITKVEIYWDNVGQPGVFDIDNFPVSSKIYKHLYPNFQSPLTRVFEIRYRAYSGGVCVDDTIRAITVNAAPLVQFNNIPPTCLDAAPFQITQASEIGGVPGTGVFSGPGVTPGGIFNPASAGPGTHTILYSFTSTTGGCVDTMSQTITVWQPPLADFEFAIPACEKRAVTFSDSSITPVGSLTTWTWDFGDGSPIVIRNNPSPFTHTFATYGTYAVRLRVTTTNGCNSVDKIINVLINPLPRPNFSTPAISCLPNATVTFTNLSMIPGGTPMTYYWDFGDPGSGAVNNSTGTNPSHSYVSTGPFNVNLQVTSDAGCVHDTTIILNSIHPQPLASFNVDKTDVCVGSAFTFTDNSDPLDGTISQWNWTMADGNTRNTPSFTYTYNTVGVYDVSLYILNSWGCRSTTYNQTVFVNPYPPVNAGPDKFVLEGGFVTLTPVLPTGIVVTYLWTPSTGLNNPAIPFPVASPPDDITYTLIITTDKGCSASDQVFVKVLKAPVIPNIFSPNGDGVHDRWEIAYLESYPGCTVDVYNRYGQLIYHSVGYSNPWDGTVNGKSVNVGTYYYIVDPKNGRKKIAGYVDVIR